MRPTTNGRLLDFNSWKVSRIELNNTTAKKLIEFYKYFLKEKRGVEGSEVAQRPLPYFGVAEIEGTVGSLLSKTYPQYIAKYVEKLRS